MHASMINPRRYALGQMAAAVGALALLISAPLQLLIALSVRGAGLFAVTALLSLVLILPLLLYLRATPPATLDDAGITLTPRVGKAVHIPWKSVRAVKPYPLLPPADTETMRRAAVGRKKYVAAEGIMLTSDVLPWTYRAVGWFAGEGFRGAFAITNRTHTDYARVKAAIERAMKSASA